DTVHSSTSQVLIARDANYQPEIRVPWCVPEQQSGPCAPTNIRNTGPLGPPVGSGLATHHVVTVNGLLPYDQFYQVGTYYYYVASTDALGVTSTAPGPVDYSQTTLPSFATLPEDPTLPESFLIYAYGPTNVFQGSDLYIAAHLHQVGGASFSHMTDVVSSAPNSGQDGIVSGPAASSISVTLLCSENSQLQSRDGSNPPYYGCYTSNAVMPNSNLKIHTTAETTPGAYSVQFTYWNSGVDTSYTYRFNVLPAPTFTASPPTSFPAIPNRANWESQMVTLGEKWCNQMNGVSRDALNAIGNFLTGWGWQEETWFYDGGRVYQQVDDYTANVLGQPNHALWQHCALTVLDPYAEYLIYNNAAMALYSVFPYGLEMDYLRTGYAPSLTALYDLEDYNGGAHYDGLIDWYSTRETSYINNVRIAAEMTGRAHNPLEDSGIDKLLGDLDQIANGGKINTIHPFMVGIDMQTLINYYEWSALHGTTDNRIPVAIKGALDALWTIWNPAHFTFAYDATSLPANDSYPHGFDSIDDTDLNGLVATAYAWYWSKTGDANALARGDLLFQHMLDPIDDPGWDGKMYSQMYQWTFDYVRLRGGPNPVLTIMPSQQPVLAPYPDTEPPIMGGAAYTKVTVTPTSTGATITWNTYEPATTQVKYGVTSGYGSASPLNPSSLTSHSATLTGLLPATLYHYQVISKDAVGNIAALQDETFTTTQ
ncbi:MAG: fibronectin type III domain-containing protein, partial [Candidatus Korobacteraceae bacterium]